MVSLKLLDEVYNIPLNLQVIDAAQGMNGAGKLGAQCGLVEGTLMFIGVWGRKRNFSYDKVQSLCKNYALLFEQRFNSLLCRQLKDRARIVALDPDHPCEELKISAISMAIDYLSDR